MLGLLRFAGIAVVLLMASIAGKAQDPAPTDQANPVPGPAQSSMIFLSGEVRVVGPQKLVDGEALTVTRAILKAGGLGEWGNARKVRLIRKINGVIETTIVNYKAIVEKGDVKNDPVLQDGDRIFVPKVGPHF
jgi:protein involved in polysaccharide export with SLBB domain